MSVYFLQKSQDVDRFEDAIGKAVTPDASLPAQVFKPPYKSFLFFEYSELQKKTFWRMLMAQPDGLPLHLVFLDPDFRWLHDKANGSYGIIRFEAGSSEEAVFAALNHSPTMNMADAFVYACHKCLVIPKDESWAIWGQREWDLAVAAFPEPAARDSFMHRSRNWAPMKTVEEAGEFIRHWSSDSAASAFVADLEAKYTEKG